MLRYGTVSREDFLHTGWFIEEHMVKISVRRTSCQSGRREEDEM